MCVCVRTCVCDTVSACVYVCAQCATVHVLGASSPVRLWPTHLAPPVHDTVCAHAMCVHASHHHAHQPPSTVTLAQLVTRTQVANSAYGDGTGTTPGTNGPSMQCKRRVTPCSPVLWQNGLCVATAQTWDATRLRASGGPPSPPKGNICNL